MSQEENGERGGRRDDLGSSFEAHSGDVGTAFEQQNASEEDSDRLRRRRRWKWIAIVLFVLLAIFIIYRLMSSGSSSNSAPGGGRGQMGPAAITTAQSTTGNMNVYVDALGTVTPEATVTIFSQITGRVMSVHYHEGQLVAKGQALVDIDPRPYQANLTQAEGQLQRDQAVLAEARIDLARYQAALARNAIAKQQVDDQEQAVQQDEGTVKADQGTVAYDQVELAYCHIVAPISGRVGLRLVDPGNTVFSGSSSTLVVITQLQPITVVFNVSEDDLPQVQEQLKGNRKLEVDAYDRADDHQIATGALTSLDNEVDTTTGTVKFRAEFANKDLSLFPNQFVNARLLVRTLQNVTLVPNAAVQLNGTAAFVYIVNPNNTVGVQPITTSSSDENLTAVQGVSSGVTLATSGFDRLENGAQVQVHKSGSQQKGHSAGGGTSPGNSAP
jgi:multidrug efflux system membrane fusion protein